MWLCEKRRKYFIKFIAFQEGFNLNSVIIERPELNIYPPPMILEKASMIGTGPLTIDETNMQEFNSTFITTLISKLPH